MSREPAPSTHAAVTRDDRAARRLDAREGDERFGGTRDGVLLGVGAASASDAHVDARASDATGDLNVRLNRGVATGVGGLREADDVSPHRVRVVGGGRPGEGA